jgi:hypothetical protein
LNCVPIFRDLRGQGHTGNAPVRIGKKTYIQERRDFGIIPLLFQLEEDIRETLTRTFLYYNIKLTSKCG